MKMQRFLVKIIPETIHFLVLYSVAAVGDEDSVSERMNWRIAHRHELNCILRILYIRTSLCVDARKSAKKQRMANILRAFCCVMSCPTTTTWRILWLYTTTSNYWLYVETSLCFAKHFDGNKFVMRKKVDIQHRRVKCLLYE